MSISQFCSTNHVTQSKESTKTYEFEQFETNLEHYLIRTFLIRFKSKKALSDEKIIIIDFRREEKKNK